ncbi:uncharacterized protein DUF4760 [Stenotrophomonas rhizophila]|uniref:Uncharacterized protein DUF4760 n=1 Tax=Stenotrophomonas rhizophila TaxID=216778 RepID=A0A498CEJ9_9GAMM|nr:DUF4760 domain-containing protein [Stenotrophomonas rhizophila]RLK56226.1 uncharacterized protein DUF4760 [Stenotrophomonas rhizophila]
MEWLKELLASEAFRGAMIGLGVVVAILSVLTSRKIAKRKQVADMLFASRGDDKLQVGCRVARDLHQAKNKNLRMMLDDPEHTKETNEILYVLNHFETVSVGIKNDIYDEKMVKDAWCTMMCNTFEYSKPLVEAMRGKYGKPTIFQEYELLVARWATSQVKHRKTW